MPPDADARDPDPVDGEAGVPPARERSRRRAPVTMHHLYSRAISCLGGGILLAAAGGGWECVALAAMLIGIVGMATARDGGWTTRPVRPLRGARKRTGRRRR